MGAEREGGLGEVVWVSEVRSVEREGRERVRRLGEDRVGSE